MANRRMISNAVVKSARFLRMPPTSQNLYFHLILNADDDGIVEAFPVMRMTGAVEDDLKILMEKKFIEVLNEDLVTYVYDWLEHNKIRADRKVDSVYKGLLFNVLPDVEYRGKAPKKESASPSKNKVNDDNHQSDKRQTDDRQAPEQVSLEEAKVVEVNLGECSEAEEKDTSSDSDLIPIFNFWEQNGFGMLPPLTMEHLEKWVEDFQEIGATRQDAIEIVLFSLHRGVEGNGKTYNYINTILKSWESSLFLTVTQIKAEDPFLNRQKKPERPKLSYEQYDDDEPYF